jgi:hypothetical protein
MSSVIQSKGKDEATYTTWSHVGFQSTWLSV